MLSLKAAIDHPAYVADGDQKNESDNDLLNHGCKVQQID
jgi:hypothetical protein